MSTETMIANARALLTVFDGYGPADSAAREAARKMIDAALLRDLDLAMKAAAKKRCEENSEEYLYDGRPYGLLSTCLSGNEHRQPPVRYTEQDAYRDYAGWLCKTERMARWVAGWITKHLDPRDSDGNPMPNRVNKISGQGWLAVRASYKIGE